MKRRTLLSALAAGTAVGAAACGNEGSGGSDGAVELTFRQFDPPTEIAGLEEAVASWNEANPDVQVTMETLSSADFAQQFAREANSGSGPDVVQLGYVNVKDLANPGILLPISDLDAEAPLDPALDQYLALDMNQFEDKTWALPWTVDTFCLAYNEEAMGGNPVPTTWEELHETAVAIGGGGVAGFLFAGASSPAAGQWFPINYYMWSNGFSLVEVTGGSAAPGGTVEQFQGAIDYFQSLITDGATPDAMSAVESINDPQIISGVANGSAAMTMMAPQTYRQARKENEALKTAVMPDGLQDGATHLGGRSLGINASTEHPDEAWRFIKYLNSAEAFSMIPQYPASTSVLADMEVADGEEGYKEQLPHSESFARYIAGPIPVTTLQRLVNAAFGSVYSGQATSAQAAQSLFDEIEGELEG